MLRSLYSGISGLRSHQTMLDVTGNNIANVNTTGFKSNAVVFQDTLSQMTQGGAAPAANAGGRNPAQVGLGVQVAGITTNFTQGSSQATGRGTDLMISGEGFFVTRQGNQNLYTRAGAFDVDAAGRLVTTDGSILQGWSATNGVVNQGAAIGDIVLPDGAVSPAQPTTTASLGGNMPSETPVGGTLTRDIKAYDAQGRETNVPVTFTRTTTGWTASGGTGGTPVNLTLNANGTLEGTKTLTAAVAGGVSVTVDLSAVTGYAGVNNMAVTASNGAPAGTIESFALSPDGTVMGSFSNGDKIALGRIVLASFTNPAGLEKAGNSSYTASANSGEAVIGAPGEAGVGGLVSGALEMSNVDLSQEFTNLIVAQRGFQANARIITTSDEVLQELTNLKR
ncbi:Flagellar hook protein FlgE [Arthrobacter saudimassiliensis]|uniref:Flagellar hook protein FlgE n=1 Tax=Arthrobacter saudimassiliensis TaxID=1461584 RepID=A0A078MK09_9MICC|nr:Flagellar hook protein FlgE [Arthrobacter saudimassiliensis]